MLKFKTIVFLFYLLLLPCYIWGENTSNLKNNYNGNIDQQCGCCQNGTCQENRQDYYDLEALGSPWDFGQVNKGQIIEKTFSVINRGEETVFIDSVSSCCGYLMIELSSWVIAPSEISQITISCDTYLKTAGSDTKYITFRLGNSNDGLEFKAPVSAYIVE